MNGVEKELRRDLAGTSRELDEAKQRIRILEEALKLAQHEAQPHHTLHEIAKECHTGACNEYALIMALAKAVKAELEPGKIRDNLDVKYIIGQISFLIHESLGPTHETVRAFAEQVEAEEIVAKAKQP